MEKDLERNTVNIRTIMKNTGDLTIKYAKVGQNPVCILFCEGQININQMANMVYRPVNSIGNDKKIPPERVMEIIQGELLLAGEQMTVTDYDSLTMMAMSGFCVILVDGVDRGIAIGMHGFERRSVQEPSTQLNIRGSREGFVEAIRINVSMLRRRVKSPDLVIKYSKKGKMSGTDICLCYIDGIADKNLVSQIEQRLEQIPLDLVLEGGYLQPFLEERGNLIFSEIGITERPDGLAAKLYEGRVGIIVDGTPFVLVVPRLFTENFQTMDDYTEKPVYVSIMRILRYVAFLTAVLLPGFYVAIADFNPELIPDALLLNLVASIEITPYNLMTECLIVHIFYEILREAGLRMPTDLGHAVSIVGGIVIGDILVSAGLVGAPIILIVAVSAISSFIVPDLYNSIVVMRFSFILAGGICGLFGITIVGMLYLYKICSMNSYGVPFTAPVSPFSFKAMRDTFIRMDWRLISKHNARLQELNGARISRKEHSR
ncbi:MAG: spore germination protein [Ruminiclostridium sp.]|nr:spore germination protein [Ruminiclostridium sp.]